jgi:hypothetical protein
VSEGMVRRGVSLSDLFDRPRLYVMNDPGGVPDEEGLRHALQEAGIFSAMMPFTENLFVMKPQRSKLVELLEILPLYGYKPAAAGGL